MREAPVSNAPIVLFDGECGLCSRSVQFVARHDASSKVRFAPLQSNVGIRLREHAGVPSGLGSVIVIDHGRAYLKSDATIRIASRLRFPWNLLRLLAVIPKPLRDWGYDVVAANRLRWFGRDDICRRPPPGLRERLLT
jgi:predicted DCC family thiol-disulfide oxidoreductase YuxK